MKKHYCFMFSLFLIVLLMFVSWSYSAETKPSDAKESFSSILRSLFVESPVKEKNIAIFPVISKEGGEKKLITLDEAMEQKTILVKELEQENVNQISIKNESDKWVFIMAGEILTGSKQDRILKEDLLLPPRSGRITVNAFCVEHGRWTYKSDKFESNKTVSNIAVRQMAKEKCNQSAVWDAVSETQKRAGCDSKTQALNETYSAPAVKTNIDNLYNRFKDLPSKHNRMNGVVIAVGDQILCVDLFASAELLDRLWPKLLKSYLLEASSRKENGNSVSISNVKKFLSETSKSGLKSYHPPGEGMILTIDSSEVTGAALMFEKNLIHSDIFPKSKEPDKKDDNVMPIQRQYRNNQENR